MWHDTIKSSALELHEWEKEWRDEEAAAEVVRAVGAWVVVVQKPVRGGEEGDLVGHNIYFLVFLFSLIVKLWPWVWKSEDLGFWQQFSSFK